MNGVSRHDNDRVSVSPVTNSSGGEEEGIGSSFTSSSPTHSNCDYDDDGVHLLAPPQHSTPFVQQQQQLHKHQQKKHYNFNYNHEYQQAQLCQKQQHHQYQSLNDSNYYSRNNSLNSFTNAEYCQQHPIKIKPIPSKQLIAKAVNSLSFSIDSILNRKTEKEKQIELFHQQQQQQQHIILQQKQQMIMMEAAAVKRSLSDNQHGKQGQEDENSLLDNNELKINDVCSMKRKRNQSLASDASVAGCCNKRIRTIFSQQQLEKLEIEFMRQQYMVGSERSYLANSLNLSEAQVKIWFQNRRIKWRKMQSDENNSDSRNPSTSSHYDQWEMFNSLDTSQDE